MAQAKIDRTKPVDGLARRVFYAPEATVVPQPKVITPAVISPKPAVISRTEPTSIVSHPVISPTAKSKRNPTTGKPFLVRLQPDLVARIQSWSTAHGAPSIPDAIRRLIDEALA